MATMTMTTSMATPLTRATVPSRTAAGAAQLGEVRMTRRGRLVVTLAAACGLTAALMGAASWIAPAPAIGSVSTTTYVVQPGDTWWSIAASLPEHGDIRGTVDVLRTLNADSRSDMVVGSQIIIPRQSK